MNLPPRKPAKTFIRNGQIVNDAPEHERIRANNIPFPGIGHSLNGPPVPNRFDAMLNQVRNFDRGNLKEVPVYYVNRSTDVLPIRSHGYVMVGNPGKGRKSGAVFYGVGGDPKRGGVDIDPSFVKKVNARHGLMRTHAFSDDVRSTIHELRGKQYSTKEEFHEDYSKLRSSKGGQPEQINKEIKRLHTLVSKEKMEMWPKQPNGWQDPHPNTAEEDIRTFENYHRSNPLTGQRKFFGHKLGWKNISLKKVENVRSIDLLEARQQFLLQQRYLDEMHGRIGTGVPEPGIVPLANEQERRRLSRATPTFQRLPPHRSDTVANCNAGAASLLQQAMNNHPNAQRLPQEEIPRPQNANFAGLGVDHRMRIWNPLSISPDARPKPRQQLHLVLRLRQPQAPQAPQKNFPGKGYSLK